MLPPDDPLDATFILEIHGHIVTGADDDHCVPGKLRERNRYVMFGTPQHRGVEGGTECRAAFERLASALGAVLLGRAGLRDTSFIAMSNYYYEQKAEYLETLARVRATDHDLTPFLKFGLKGVKLQSQRLLELIQKEISKGLFRNLMYELYHRLKTQKRRVIAERQIGLLNVLLSREWVELDELVDASAALKWPTQFTETEIFAKFKRLPKAKTHSFLG